jgi:hypothetical protein
MVRVASGGGVGIMDASQAQHLLGGVGRAQASATWSRDDVDAHGATVGQSAWWPLCGAHPPCCPSGPHEQG